MKKILKCFTIIFSVSLLLLFSFNLYAAEKPYKIGVNLGLTGFLSEINQYIKKAMVMEVERVNKMGGINGHPMELIFLDNGLDVSRGAANMMKFARNPEVLAVVGPLFDAIQMATRSISEKQKIVSIVICPSNPIVRKAKYKWSFNIAQSDILVASKMVDLAKAHGYKNLLVFRAENPIALGIAQQIKNVGQKENMHVIIAPQTHKSTDIDMTPQLIQMKPVIKKEKVDVMMLSTEGPPGAVICKNMKALGIKLPRIGTHAFGFAPTISIGGEAMEGVEFPAGKTIVPYQLDKDDPAREVIQAFDKRMKARYGIGADQLSGHGYDIVWILANALKRCKNNVNRKRLRDEIENTKGFVGCTGIYNYSPDDHDGLSKTDFVFVRIENGKYKRIKFPELK